MTTLRECSDRPHGQLPDSYDDVRDRIMRMKRTLICERCNERMEIIDKSSRVLDRSQVDDLPGAGDGESPVVHPGKVPGTFEITEITYKCPRCNVIVYEWR